MLACYILKYPLKCAPAVTTGAHFSGYYSKYLKEPCCNFLKTLPVVDETRLDSWQRATYQASVVIIVSFSTQMGHLTLNQDELPVLGLGTFKAWD